ncbi:MAG TPA: tetratricopeptide repeat protein [Candidatus Angelobacter sp.]|nr:tetratricopeptide repeat protein [Candidatus Angelobacter sp.]
MMPRLMLLFILLASFLSADAAQDDPKVAARAELNAGVQAFRQANYEEAVGHFEQAIALDPQSVTAHLYLATAYAQTFVPGVDTPENVVWATKALNEYREVLQLKPSDVISLKGIAFLEMQLKNFDQAKESYQKAIAADPNDPELFYSVGVVDWMMAYRDIGAEKKKLSAKAQDSLFLSAGCADARAATLANVNDGLAMLTKAISLREDYDDAMVYLNLLYRLRADVDCGNQEAHAADLKKANEWTDMAMAARKKKADAAAAGKSGQGSTDTPPPR